MQIYIIIHVNGNGPILNTDFMFSINNGSIDIPL